MADDPLISLGAAARAIGINKSTLSRQIKAGSIRAHNGKVRLSEVLEDRAANIDLTQSHRRSAGATVHATAGATGSVSAENGEPAVLLDGRLVSFSEAQRLKENYLGRLRQLEFETKSGRLIDADVAKTRVFELARAERDALVNWPARVAPLIAAEIGANQVALAVAMEKHVRQFLAERSEPRLHIEN